MNPWDRLGNREAKGEKKDELINKDSQFIPTRLAAHCSMLQDTDFLEVYSNSSLELEIAVNVCSTWGWACKKSSLASLPRWQVWDIRCSFGGSWVWTPATLPPSCWPLDWSSVNCPILLPISPSSGFYSPGPSHSTMSFPLPGMPCSYSFIPLKFTEYVSMELPLG